MILHQIASYRGFPIGRKGRLFDHVDSKAAALRLMQVLGAEEGYYVPSKGLLMVYMERKDND